MTLDEIRAWLKENEAAEEVVAFMKELNPEVPITIEAVGEFLETEEGRQLVQPMIDTRVTEAIKTYKTGHFDKEVRAAVAGEILKINPAETPEQKQIRELREGQDKMQKDIESERLTGRIKELAFNLGIPPQFVDGIPFPSTDEFSLYGKRLKEYVEEAKTTAVNDILAKGAFQPGAGDGAGNGQIKKDISKLSFEEALQMEENNELDAVLKQ